jgi:hypothetical protein
MLPLNLLPQQVCNHRSGLEIYRTGVGGF